MELRLAKVDLIAERKTPRLVRHPERAADCAERADDAIQVFLMELVGRYVRPRNLRYLAHDNADLLLRLLQHCFIVSLF